MDSSAVTLKEEVKRLLHPCSEIGHRLENTCDQPIDEWLEHQCKNCDMTRAEIYMSQGVYTDEMKLTQK